MTKIRYIIFCSKKKNGFNHSRLTNQDLENMNSLTSDNQNAESTVDGYEKGSPKRTEIGCKRES